MEGATLQGMRFFALCASTLVALAMACTTATPSVTASLDAAATPDATPSTDTIDAASVIDVVDGATGDEGRARDALDVVLPRDSGGTCRYAPSTADGRIFQGTGDILDGGTGTHSERLTAYFPMGRVAGAPVVVGVLRTWPRPGMVEARGTLDTNLGATGLEFRGTDGSDVQWTASLLGPDDGFVMNVTRNRAVFTDVGDYVQATLRLCPTEAAPEPTWNDLPAVLPGADIRLVPRVPLGATTPAGSLMVGGASVATAQSLDDGALRIHPQGPVPPNADITLAPLGLRDVLGRELPTPAIRVLRTTAVISDRTFATAPTAGAVVTAGTTVTHENGALRIGSFTRGPLSALLALGEVPAGAVSLRLTLSSLQRADLTLRLLRADGSATGVDIPEAPFGAAQTVTATVPGSGALWLAVEDRTSANRPGWLPAQAQALVIDEVVVGP